MKYIDARYIFQFLLFKKSFFFVIFNSHLYLIKSKEMVKNVLNFSEWKIGSRSYKRNLGLTKKITLVIISTLVHYNNFESKLWVTIKIWINKKSIISLIGLPLENEYRLFLLFWEAYKTDFETKKYKCNVNIDENFLRIDWLP